MCRRSRARHSNERARARASKRLFLNLIKRANAPVLQRLLVQRHATWNGAAKLPWCAAPTEDGWKIISQVNCELHLLLYVQLFATARFSNHISAGIWKLRGIYTVIVSIFFIVLLKCVCTSSLANLIYHLCSFVLEKESFFVFGIIRYFYFGFNFENICSRLLTWLCIKTVYFFC